MTAPKLRGLPHSTEVPVKRQLQKRKDRPEAGLEVNGSGVPKGVKERQIVLDHLMSATDFSG